VQKADSPRSRQRDPEPGPPHLVTWKGVRAPAQHQFLSFWARAGLRPAGLGACAKQTCACLPAKCWVDVARGPVYSQKSKLSCQCSSKTIEPLILWERNHQRPVEFSIYKAWCVAPLVQTRTRSHSCPVGTSALLSLVLAIFCNRRNYLRFLNFSI